MSSVSVTDCIADELRSLPARDATDTQVKKKKNYAEALSRLLATKLANGLRPYFEGIMPDEEGRKQESPAQTSKGYKKLDINYSTPNLVSVLEFPIATRRLHLTFG